MVIVSYEEVAMRKRSMILALVGLVIGMLAAVTTTATAAKPTPELGVVETMAFHVKNCPSNR